MYCTRMRCIRAYRCETVHILPDSIRQKIAQTLCAQGFEGDSITDTKNPEPPRKTFPLIDPHPNSDIAAAIRTLDSE